MKTRREWKGKGVGEIFLTGLNSSLIETHGRGAAVRHPEETWRYFDRGVSHEVYVAQQQVGGKLESPYVSVLLNLRC